MKSLVVFGLLLTFAACAPQPPPPGGTAAGATCSTSAPTAAHILRRALQRYLRCGALWRGDTGADRWELRSRRHADKHAGKTQLRQDLVQGLSRPPIALPRQD